MAEEEAIVMVARKQEVGWGRREREGEGDRRKRREKEGRGESTFASGFSLPFLLHPGSQPIGWCCPHSGIFSHCSGPWDGFYLGCRCLYELFLGLKLLGNRRNHSQDRDRWVREAHISFLQS